MEKSTIIATILTFLAVGLGTFLTIKFGNEERVIRMKDAISYVKDPKTNLCFAILKDKEQIIGFSNVNCDEVK